jgi:hypothetical protein
MAEIDLAFIARQLERLVDDVAGLKDDMPVVMARLDLIDATTHSLVTEVRAMHSRHDRSPSASSAWRIRTARCLPDAHRTGCRLWHYKWPDSRS